MASDPFSFDAPLRPIDGNFAKRAGQKHDAWFVQSHAQLLQAAPVGSVSRKVHSSTTSKSTKSNPASKPKKPPRTNSASSIDSSIRRPISVASKRAGALSASNSNGSQKASTSAMKSSSQQPSAEARGTKRERSSDIKPSSLPRSGSALKRRAGPSSARSGANTAAAAGKPAQGRAANSNSNKAAPTIKRRPVTAKSKLAGQTAEQALAEKLAAHNSKFSKSASYEPRSHGVRDVRRWERATGKAYSKLPYAERAEANKAIAEMKKQAAAEAGCT